MEVEQKSNIGDTGGGGGKAESDVTVTCTSFSVNEQLISTDDDDFELPETTYRSRHVQLLNALGADVHDADADFGDIQFFHHPSSQLHQQFQFHQQSYLKETNDDEEFDIIDVSDLTITSGSHNNKGMGNSATNNSSENPFVFPDNVMEYGEPQFFPGNCVGYLETILEETDEEYEEEEGCSGRHWWTADSDTDTDSVIRVDNNGQQLQQQQQQQATVYTNPFAFKAENAAAVAAANGTKNNGMTTFRTTASSKPFELEDLQLLDQLDLAFEETFLDSHSNKNTNPFAGMGNTDDFFGFSKSVEKTQGEEENEKTEICEENSSSNKKVVPQFADDVQPAEVNEEDFFYSSSEEEEEEDSEVHSEEATTSSSSSSDDGKNDGVVLAEFSLNSSFTSATANRYRRSFEGSSLSNSNKLRSFRSFDSLNCLAGTELLFSKADTFPSFGYIKEEATGEVGECIREGGGVGGSSSSSSSCRDRKNSDSSAEQMSGDRGAEMMSTENLSEDSGIGEAGSALNLNSPHQSSSSQAGSNNLNSLTSNSSANSNNDGPNSLGSYIAKSEFALNPFVYSSAENSMSCGSLPTQSNSVPATEEGSGPVSATNQANINQSTVAEAADQNISMECGSDGDGRSSSSSSSSNSSEDPSIPRDHQEHEHEEVEEMEDSQEGMMIREDEEPSSWLSNVEPDIVAQCNINVASSHQATLATEQGLIMGKPCNSTTSTEEFQGLPGLAIVQDKSKYTDYKLTTLDLPPPNSEVLLKFTDEDEIIYSSESHAHDDAMEEEDTQLLGGDGGAGAKSNEMKKSEQFIPTESSYGTEVTTVRDVNNMSNTAAIAIAALESGPMPASSVQATEQTGLCSTNESKDLFIHNNNSVSSSSSSSHLHSNFIDEKQQDPWLEQKQSQQHHQQQQQEQEKEPSSSCNGSDSVCVQKSNWTDQCMSSGGGGSSGSSSVLQVESISGYVQQQQQQQPESDNDISTAPISNLINNNGPVVLSDTQQEPSVVPDILSLAEMELVSSVERRSTSPQGSIKTKTYGPRNEVEVVLISSRTPSPIIKMESSETTSPTSPVEPKKKEVHFCPVVSEISWRESYIEGSENNSESSDNILDGPSASVDDDEDEDDVEEDEEQEVECNNEVKKSVIVQEQVIAQPSPPAIPNLVTSSAENNVHEDRNGHVYEDVGLNGDEACAGTTTMEKHQQKPSTLSIVPDLLSQCENVPVPQTHTHITVNIETKSLQEPQQERPQQQIFPTIFAEKLDAKNGKSKNKAAKLSIIKGASKSTSSQDETAVTVAPPKDASASAKSSKPGFFERLTKIRLSGSKNKNSNKKQKVHPKEKENIQKLGGGEASLIHKQSPASPILKKSSPATATTTNARHHGTQAEEEEDEITGERSTQAFESILDDIAGINNIKLRQRQQSASPIPSGRLAGSPSPQQEQKTRRSAERKQFFVSTPEQLQQQQQQRSASVERSTTLDTKLSQFKEDATRDRDQLSKSHPDLETIQGVVRDSISVTIEEGNKKRQQKQPSQSNTLPKSAGEIRATSPEKTEREWYKILKTAADKYYYRGKGGGSSKGSKTGIVETDLDTGASREMLDLDSELVEKVPTYSTATSSTAKTRSLTNLTSKPHLSLPPQQDQLLLPPGADLSDSEERAKSLEFLLDGNNQKLSVPPENKLQQESRQLSEHELRIQRSLQKLNVPEWYKKNAPTTSATQSSSILKPADAKLNKRSDFGSASGLAGGWTGLSTYKTASLTSLQNSRYTGTINRNFVRGRPATMSVNRTSRESLLSPSSTASQSPSAFERCSFTYGMPFTLTRFGHGRLSTGSASVSPPSTPGNPVGPTYTKRPYLGWRSQERLANIGGTTATSPTGTGGGLKLSLYRPPEERLAAELLSSRHRSKSADRPPLPKPPPRDERTVLSSTRHSPLAMQSFSSSSTPHVGPSVHDSIREVTEQINQLVHKEEDVETENEPPPRPKPRQKAKRPNIWIESSFVGTKPAVAASTH